MREKYLRLAAELALNSGCLRAKRGAVITKDNEVLVQAYNIPYPSNDFCQKQGCLRDKLKLGLGKELEKCRAIHAEARAVCLAAEKGISLKGAVVWTTAMPCINCAKLILAAGVRAVYYLDVYGDRAGEVFLKKMGVRCKRMRLKKDEPEKRLRDVEGQK